MASNRIGRINEEIQRELAQQLRLLKDPRVQKTMVSITHVETTPDLRYAKVYVSLLDRSCAKEVLAGLKSSGGFLPVSYTHLAAGAGRARQARGKAARRGKGPPQERPAWEIVSVSIRRWREYEFCEIPREGGRR